MSGYTLRLASELLQIAYDPNTSPGARRRVLELLDEMAQRRAWADRQRQGA